MPLVEPVTIALLFVAMICLADGLLLLDVGSSKERANQFDVKNAALHKKVCGVIA
jgi:hypothetical protein